MKKFDIEKAKNGAAVCMRDGTPVKIIDFDFNGEILYKFKREDGEDTIICCGTDGIFKGYNGTHKPEYDIVMGPKYGYMAIRVSSENIAYGLKLHTTLEDAKKEEESIKHDKYSRLLAYAKVELIDEDDI